MNSVLVLSTGYFSLWQWNLIRGKLDDKDFHMQHLDRITINPLQCGGRPCIRGMRIRVKDVLDLLAAGVPEAEILTDFPYLEAEDIRAALEFAAAQTDHPVFQST